MAPQLDVSQLWRALALQQRPYPLAYDLLGEFGDLDDLPLSALGVGPATRIIVYPEGWRPVLIAVEGDIARGPVRRCSRTA